MADLETPVLIVGGGPTGLAASICLSRHGVPSLLVEQHASTTDHPRATVVNTRTYELFRQWGIDGAVRAGGLAPERSRYVVWATTLAGWELGRLDLAPAASQPGAQSPCTTGICPQDVYEPILRAAASALPGADVRYATTLVSFAHDDDGVVAVIRRDGRDLTVRARWLLACDGAASGVRERLGVAMVGPDDLGSLLNVHVRADLTPYIAGREGPLYWIVNADAPGVFIALDGPTRWLFNTPVRRGQLERDVDAERCRALVRRAAGDPALAVDVRSIDPWIMRSQVAECYRVGRVFLLGDAAHRFPPTGGFGMNTGVQDAHNLAWKLAGVLHGWAAPALLDTYEAERRPVAQANADQSHENARSMPNPFRDADGAHPLAGIEEDSAAGAALRARVAGGIAGTRAHFSAQGQAKGFAYASAAVVPDGTVAAASSIETYVPSARPGHVAPHAWIRQDGRTRSLLDLFGGAFVLLVGPEGRAWRRAAEAMPPSVPLDVHVVGDGIGCDVDWCGLYDVEPDGAVLVRPDGHVAWRQRTSTDAGATLPYVLARAVLRNRG